MKLLAPALALLVSAVRAEVVTLATPIEALPEKSTVVWSPLFQAAWEKLDADPSEPPEKAMTPLLRWTAGQVTPEGWWKKWTGPETPDFLKQVNGELAAITGGKADPFRLARAEDHANRAVFGLLDCDEEFQRVFVRSRKAAMDFQVGERSQPVHFFGIRYVMSKQLSDTARVLAYRPVDHSHALQIRGKAADESVILYLPAKPQDFATACRWLRTWKTPLNIDDPRLAAKAPVPHGAWNDPSLHAGDEIRIPSIDLATKSGVTSHRGDKPESITHVEQITRFQLHEKAAHIPNEALSGVVDPFAERQLLGYSRQFIYDRPFFVFLWRDGAEWPYFGAWIGDASALKAFP